MDTTELDQFYKVIDEDYCDNRFFDAFENAYNSGDDSIKAQLLKEFILKWHDADTCVWLMDMLN